MFTQDNNYIPTNIVIYNILSTDVYTLDNTMIQKARWIAAIEKCVHTTFVIGVMERKISRKTTSDIFKRTSSYRKKK